MGTCLTNYMYWHELSALSSCAHLLPTLSMQGLASYNQSLPDGYNISFDDLRCQTRTGSEHFRHISVKSPMSCCRLGLNGTRHLILQAFCNSCMRPVCAVQIQHTTPMNSIRPSLDHMSECEQLVIATKSDKRFSHPTRTLTMIPYTTALA